MTETLTLTPGQITLQQLRRLAAGGVAVALDEACRDGVSKASAMVDGIVAEDRSVYGVSTGFGLLANKRIPQDDLTLLQRNLVLSHCTGVGAPLPDDVIRLVLALKATALARGHSGVRWALIDALLRLLESEIYPVIPCKGSVGASGDLAPLAHLAAVLLGVGEVRYHGEVLPAVFGLKRAGLAPLELAPKEGLALLNGTQGRRICRGGGGGGAVHRRRPGQRCAVRPAYRPDSRPGRPDRHGGCVPAPDGRQPHP
jgi:histidine ammonia-lyase